MGTWNWVFKALLLVSVCTCGRSGWIGGVVGREGGRASPHRALAPPPTQLKYVHTHTDTHTGSPGFCCLSCACVAATEQASFCCLGTWAHSPGASMGTPPLLSETPGHISAWPMSFQHPGPTADAISLKKPFLTNSLLCVSPKTDPETRIWCKPLLWNVVPGAQ